ncbi:MAG: hypothetical protein WBK77_05225 [Alphaproteobacteria bacterium]
MNSMTSDLSWWITAFDLPAMAGLFWLIWHTRRDSEAANDDLHALLEQRSTQLREALNAFKLEVAKTYASHNDLREVETRLTSHLLRIEAKLDTTALKAEALNAAKK